MNTTTESITMKGLFSLLTKPTGEWLLARLAAGERGLYKAAAATKRGSYRLRERLKANYYQSCVEAEERHATQHRIYASHYRRAGKRNKALEEEFLAAMCQKTAGEYQAKATLAKANAR